LGKRIKGKRNLLLILTLREMLKCIVNLEEKIRRREERENPKKVFRGGGSKKWKLNTKQPLRPL